MLIRYFRKLQAITPVLLFLIGAALWAEVYLYPEPVFFQEVINPAPFYKLLLRLIQAQPFVSWIIAYLFLYLQALMINQILTSQGILDKYSFIASLLYVMLMSSDLGLLFLHPVLFSNFFLLIALQKILKAYNEDETMLEVFNVGVLIALAGLFHYQAWLFLLALIISLFIFYLISMRSFLAAMIGFFIPFMFYAVVLFLWDKLDKQLLEIPFYLSWFGNSTGELSNIKTALIAVAGGLGLLAFFHLVFLYIPDKPIRLRKRLWSLVYFFLVSLLCFLFMPNFRTYDLALLFIPLSALLAGFFHQIDRKVIAEVLFTLLVGLIVAGKVHVLVP